MALPSSPPISLQDILTEFSAPQNTPLTSLVRGGAYVPNTAANAGVPTVPPISVLDFLGASAVPPLSATLHPATISDDQIVGTAHAELNLSNTGVEDQIPGPNYTWMGSGAASSYEVRVTVTAGALTGGSGTGAWLNLGTTRLWYLERSGVGTSTCNITVEIRPAGGGANLASGNYVLEATKSP